MNSNNMGNGNNLIAIGFKSFSEEDKRKAFITMDLMLKQLHQSGYVVTSFEPSTIIFQDGYYSFDSIQRLEQSRFEDKEEAIIDNIAKLSTLAVSCYLSEYNLDQGLLSTGVISVNYNRLESLIPVEDRAYYRSVLVDSYQLKKLSGEVVYYSDYIINMEKQNQGVGNSHSLVRATDIGKAFATKDEAAFGHTFFLMTVVSSIMVLLIGAFFYFLTI